MGIIDNLKKIDTFRRFRTTSKRESKNIISRDRGALSRIAAWFAELGTLTLVQSLSNNLSTVGFGQTLVTVSNAGFAFLTVDAAVSVEEIVRNKHIYSKKKKAAQKYIEVCSSEKELDLTKEDGIKMAYYYAENLSHPISFADRHGMILKQLFVDFKDKAEYDEIRNVIITDYNLSSSDIKRIENEANTYGYVSKATVKSICSEKRRLEFILDSIACRDFVSRIYNVRKNEVSMLNSGSHLEGALTLTPQQQVKHATNFALTEEQEYIRKTIGMSKVYMREKLKEIHIAVRDNRFEDAKTLQRSILSTMSDAQNESGKLEQKILFDVDGRKDVKKIVDKSAKKTAEHSIANWTRHVLPLSKKIGAFAKLLQNAVQDKLMFRGELKAHRAIKKFEKQNKVRVADVYTENGAGYRALRKQFKKLAEQNDQCKDILKEQPDMPKNLACGHSRFAMFDSVKDYLFDSIYDICDNAKIMVKDGQNYRATRYLDDPVVIKVYGNGYGGVGDPTTPIAVYNADHIDSTMGIIHGLLESISEGTDGDEATINQLINSIEIVSGNTSRTVYATQIARDVKLIREDSDNFDAYKKSFLAKAVKAVAVEEDFVRIIDLDDHKIDSWMDSYASSFPGSEVLEEATSEPEETKNETVQELNGVASKLTRDEIVDFMTRFNTTIDSTKLDSKSVSSTVVEKMKDIEKKRAAANLVNGINSIIDAKLDETINPVEDVTPDEDVTGDYKDYEDFEEHETSDYSEISNPEKYMKDSSDELDESATKTGEKTAETTPVKTVKRKTTKTTKSSKKTTYDISVYEELVRVVGNENLSDEQKDRIKEILGVAKQTKKGILKKKDSKVKRIPTIDTLKERLEALKEYKKQKLEQYAERNKASKYKKTIEKLEKVKASIARVEGLIEEFEKFIQDCESMAPTVDQLRRQLRKMGGVKGGVTRSYNKIILEKTSAQIKQEKLEQEKSKTKEQPSTEELVKLSGHSAVAVEETAQTEVVETTEQATEEITYPPVAKKGKKHAQLI